ncbi:MAG: hypothetical protein EBQ56_00155, partial [Proteobacteria bacterium]|nr:hypothetical protein [Pseudomonadota bacterium]
GLHALLRDAAGQGATHLIVQDRRRIGGVEVTNLPGNPSPMVSGLVVIEAAPVHLFHGHRQRVLSSRLVWPR